VAFKRTVPKGPFGRMRCRAAPLTLHSATTRFPQIGNTHHIGALPLPMHFMAGALMGNVRNAKAYTNLEKCTYSKKILAYFNEISSTSSSVTAYFGFCTLKYHFTKATSDYSHKNSWARPIKRGVVTRYELVSTQ